MPNLFAYLMLLAWPLVTIVLFKRLSAERALIWTVLGAFLLLPPVAEFNFPLIPSLNKVSIPNLAAFLACVFMLGRRIPLMPVSWIGRMLLLLFVLSPFATALSNSDPILIADGISRPGMAVYDAFSLVAGQFVALLPFFLARQLLATDAAQREILWALLIAGLIYSLPMLWEIRMSPQLNIWIYGFFPHDFGQQMRLEGFRPVVFMGHGLVVAFFAMTALAAGLALTRTAPPQTRAGYFFAVLYLGIVLILCKTVSAWLYTLFLIPMLLWLQPRTQIRVAAGLALIALCYPLLRASAMFPMEAILDYAEIFGADRAESLRFRFEHEKLLLDRANQRSLLGWGTWGRGRVYDQFGRNITVTDGYWIILLGNFGWLGYMGQFGLLTLPLFLLARLASRRRAGLLSAHVGALALLLGVNLIELLPNSTLIPLTWLIAGALVGYVEAMKASTKTVERGRGYRGQRPRFHSPAS